MNTVGSRYTEDAKPMDLEGRLYLAWGDIWGLRKAGPQWLSKLWACLRGPVLNSFSLRIVNPCCGKGGGYKESQNCLRTRVSGSEGAIRWAFWVAPWACTAARELARLGVSQDKTSQSYHHLQLAPPSLPICGELSKVCYLTWPTAQSCGVGWEPLWPLMPRDEETQCVCVCVCVWVLSNLPEASDSHSGSWSEHTDLQTAFSLENAPLTQN